MRGPAGDRIAAGSGNQLVPPLDAAGADCRVSPDAGAGDLRGIPDSAIRERRAPDGAQLLWRVEGEGQRSGERLRRDAEPDARDDQPRRTVSERRAAAAADDLLRPE